MELITKIVAERLVPFDQPAGTEEKAVETLTKQLASPETLPKETFLRLQKFAEGLDMCVAMGQDCQDGFDEMHQHVNNLLDRSQWTMHPDYGCVLVSEVRSRDGF